MAKRTKVRDYDQFIVRLPPGMRDRIKAKADRASMSMNEAIVWCLERYFPAPATLAQRVDELAKKIALLRRSNVAGPDMDDIIELLDITLSDVAEGKATDAPESFREKVSKRLLEWEMDEIEDAADPFDDANWPADEDPFPDPPPKDRG